MPMVIPQNSRSRQRSFWGFYGLDIECANQDHSNISRHETGKTKIGEITPNRFKLYQPYFDDEHGFDGKSMNVHVCNHDSPLSDFREIFKISKN
jgi:hypothetical protein